ncbi:major facilitator superfamily domain-containing protein [Apodospora peruviana]|uniref:Major facilitator superfamily domain-containing protein n=1 Tax=Apodospora peruviana TaxID=516989 RepID=A0AAE0HSB0_9PEZI|nr:major facilitator superfamily domain-containing protein [Apodospora peruviana]
MGIRALPAHLYRESGLQSVYSTGRDAWLIILNRSCRMFAYGACALILALFFVELEVSDSRIGLFMSLTLLGDVVLSLLLTLIADRVGRRLTLFAGSVMMIASGTIFALCENFWLLLFASVVGVISATGGDFGPFRAIEESTVSELTSPATRADVLGWYVTLASIGSSVGTEASGRVVEFLVSRRGWTLLDAYHACFWLYAIMGGLNLINVLCMSSNCELKKKTATATAPAAAVEQDEATTTSQSAPPVTDGVVDETAPLLLGDNPDTPQQKKGSSWRQGANISRDTLSVMILLWALLMLDSFADGMVYMSLTTYFLSTKFPSLPKSTLGDMLSTAWFLCSVSTVFAGPLARHIGLVNTMVFTHIPSSAAVLFFPFPKTIGWTYALLLLRLGLNNMDQAPRAAMIAAVVRPEERTAVMGITGMLRTLAGSVGPSVTGVLAGDGRFWIAFVVAGSARLAYDVGLWALFVNVRLHRHELPEEEETPVQAGVLGDEEGVIEGEGGSVDGTTTPRITSRPKQTNGGQAVV